MDAFAFLCAQQLLEDLLDTASSSDEDDEREDKMNVLKSLCLLNVMDNLDDSCTSSDEDDAFFAVLGYAQLLEKAENISRHKSRNIASTKNNQKRKNSANDLINSTPENKVRRLNNDNEISTTSVKHSNEAKGTSLIKEEEIATVMPENTNEIQDNPLENNSFSSSAEFDLKENILTDGDNTNLDKEAELRSVLSFLVQGQENFDESIMDSLSENEFKQYFHISRQCVTYIMEIFYSWYCKSHHDQISLKPNIKATMLPFLWFCANPVRFESVAEMFNTSLTDMIQHFKIILNFFEEILPENINLPSSYSEKETIAKDFEKIDGFPNVLGCLVESYFTLHEENLVQKVDSSKIYLRAIFDSSRKFLSLKVCLPKDSDSDKFLEKDLPKLCFPKYHLLGDVKCPIRDHLVISFINTENLNEIEKYFNIKFKQTYGGVDNAFGVLRNRFRQLNCLGFNDIETLSKFIIACCIIHNICIDKQDFYNDKSSTDESNCDFCGSLASAKSDNFLSDLGVMKRYELSQILFRVRK